MANVDEKVMAMVEAELAKNPDTGSSDLFEMAKAEEPSIGELSLRQFHARYPLQVKRRAAAAASAAPGKKAASKKARSRKAASKKAPTKTKAAKKTKAVREKPEPKAAARGGRRRRGLLGRREPLDPREAVRGILMRFATELASADAKADVVKVLAGADRYVDEVIDATAS